MSIDSVTTTMVPYEASPKAITNLEDEFLEAGNLRNAEILKDCISKGVDITVVRNSNTVLHEFFSRSFTWKTEDIATLDILLTHKDIGKIINARNEEGDTPLLAMLKGVELEIKSPQVVILKNLLKAGAIADDVNNREDTVFHLRGDNALHLAFKHSFHGCGKVFHLIIENTARNIDEMSLTSALEVVPLLFEIKSLVSDYVGTAERRLYALANGIFSKSTQPLPSIASYDSPEWEQQNTKDLDLAIPILILAGADPAVVVTEWQVKNSTKAPPLSSFGDFPPATTLIEFIHGKNKLKFDSLKKHSALFYEAKEKVDKQRLERRPKHSVVDLTRLRESLSKVSIEEIGD